MVGRSDAPGGMVNASYILHLRVGVSLMTDGGGTLLRWSPSNGSLASDIHIHVHH